MERSGVDLSGRGLGHGSPEACPCSTRLAPWGSVWWSPFGQSSVDLVLSSWIQVSYLDKSSSQVKKPGEIRGGPKKLYTQSAHSDPDGLKMFEACAAREPY